MCMTFLSMRWNLFKATSERFQKVNVNKKRYLRGSKNPRKKTLLNLTTSLGFFKINSNLGELFTGSFWVGGC